MGYWDGHPDTYGTPAPAPVLDYRPRAPFCLWEDDDFVEGLAAIKDGA
jgi:hypothetical protein